MLHATTNTNEAQNKDESYNVSFSIFTKFSDKTFIQEKVIKSKNSFLFSSIVKFFYLSFGYLLILDE